MMSLPGAAAVTTIDFASVTVNSCIGPHAVGV
jgi:hypothetical protein